MKRLCLYAGYDKEGVVQDYVLYYIKEMSKISDVYYLADCSMREEELDKIRDYTKSVRAYRHEKYDFGSWAELINQIGWDKVCQYDELVLCNDSCFGPIYDISQIFEKMSAKSVDFWGITQNTYLQKTHIQSYFIVFKSSVIRSKIFQDFMNGIKKEDDKMQVVYKYELVLTQLLEKAGFHWVTYIDASPFYFSIDSSKNENFRCPSYYWAESLVCGVPFIKTCLFHSLAFDEYIKSLYKFDKVLKRYSDYDFNIIKNYLKKQNLVDVNGINYFVRWNYLAAKRFLSKKFRSIRKKFKKHRNQIKYLALYLPQFHRIKENDEWWGEGFTEWTNTKPAVPFFEGHYQPHEPHDDIGYYDLSDVNVMVKQAQMAKKYGIYGFSYYYYWFNGRKLMEKPLENMLNTPDVDIPFCLFWANHNWTRSWDAGNKEILLEQTYDENTHEKFIDDLIPYFNDRRYIRIDNKPLLLIYQADQIPNPKASVKNWRKYAKNKYGLDLYLVTIQQNNSLPPNVLGYDAVLESAPNYTAGFTSILEESKKPQLPSDVEMTFYDYLKNIMYYILSPRPFYKKFGCVYPMWDNTARRKKKLAWMFYGATPDLFQKFLVEMTLKTIKYFKPEEQFLFINAWNEWAEGTHLEPDKKYGYTYLEICKQVFDMDKNMLKKQGFSKKEKICYLKKSKKLFIKLILNEINPFKKIKKENKRIITFLGYPLWVIKKKIS